MTSKLFLNSILKLASSLGVFYFRKRNIKEEHFEEFHAKVACECGEMIEKMFLADHKVGFDFRNLIFVL